MNDTEIRDSDLEQLPSPRLWANSVFELRDAYRAMRQAIAEHPDRPDLVRRYEELYAEFQRERLEEKN